MEKRPGETVYDVDTLFRLGVVAAMTDEQLLERFAADRNPTWNLLLKQLCAPWPMVLGVRRRRLRDLHAAEDAFQATFLVLAMKAATVRKRQSLGPWLHSVATRIARRAVLASRRRKEMPMPLESIVDP